MVWLVRTIGVLLLVVAPLLWGLAMARLFTRRARRGDNASAGEEV